MPYPELVSGSASSCASSSAASQVTERSGVLLHRKPAGITSHDVVARVRRELPRGVKVGHAGTLDPFATGLLLVLVGRATRAQRFLMALPKTYRAVARLGWISDTGDRDGSLERTGRVPVRLELPTGELMQRPPAYSAVRVGGERRLRAGAPRRGARARAAAGDGFTAPSCSGTRASARRSRSSARRAPTCAALSPSSATRTARSSSAPRSARSGLEDADPERLVPLSQALAFLPERRARRRGGRGGRHGRRVAAAAGESGPQSA